MNSQTSVSSDEALRLTPDEVSSRMPDERTLYELADLFRVFGDSTRIKILCALSVSDLCVADIASLLSMTQSAISHQLRVLKQVRLVRVARKGRSSVYSLDDDHVRTIFDQGFRHVRHIAPSSERGEAK
ncbi:MAG TPA: metalloregulator ArsR/SmtB family transcription factor [Synergistales bacterium]|jgi:ArsR family transcriptional regulator|nr:metalloregulator ArsR/SmtB family transcription factor [Synergistaceae bacterium]MDD3916992.1 metalloregulator ArsR/SmtB family transcription factor [Synergistaceae bacterium]NLD96192.1 winged helix-turn-helix transcriptional regulator [Synergistaceae bacterium]HPE65078.1 metalloregulator ArsR/SmtB family transcription factor [Synergistales bacterium]HRV97616.1 metalloregulator ArsR/SmtB family transcription factor [Aminobacteriaceae bacterium]